MQNFTYQMGSGVVLNTDGIPGVDNFVDVTKVSGLDSAPARTASRSTEGADGTFMDAEYQNGRTLALDTVIYSNVLNISAYLDSLKAAWEPQFRQATVQFNFQYPGVDQRFLLAKPLGISYDHDTAMRLGTVNATFTAFCEDPRIYSSVQQIGQVQLASATTSGFGFPLGFPFGFGVTTVFSSGSVVTNAGNRYAPAVLTIPGPIVNPIIINDTTGSTLPFNITLNSGDNLVIDLKAHTVQLNGGNVRTALTAPDWFLLKPGDNLIRLLAGSATPVVMTVAFYNAWR
jgi:hypothetical protein